MATPPVHLSLMHLVAYLCSLCTKMHTTVQFCSGIYPTAGAAALVCNVFVSCAVCELVHAYREMDWRIQVMHVNVSALSVSSNADFLSFCGVFLVPTHPSSLFKSEGGRCVEVDPRM